MNLFSYINRSGTNQEVNAAQPTLYKQTALKTVLRYKPGSRGFDWKFLLT
jgi:hypothetical protein